MSNFTPLVKRKFIFEGDEVEVVFARLKRKHLLKLVPEFLKVKDQLEVVETQTKMELLDPLLNSLGDHAEEYIRSLTGLKDAEGEDISISQVIEDSYFLTLFTEIIVAMVEESMPTGKV